MNYKQEWEIIGVQAFLEKRLKELLEIKGTTNRIPKSLLDINIELHYRLINELESKRKKRK